jgi:hypothetical protein
MATCGGEEGGSGRPTGMVARVGRPGEKGERPGPGGIVTFQNYSKIFISELN